LKNPDLTSKAIYYQMADLFEVSAIYSHNKALLFRAKPYIDKEAAIFHIKQRLKPSGYKVNFREEGDELLIDIRESASWRIPKLNIFLFFATLATMFLAPIMSTEAIFQPAVVYKYLSQPGVIQGRLEFTVALMAILIFHEFGHFLLAKLFKTRISYADVLSFLIFCILN